MLAALHDPTAFQTRNYWFEFDVFKSPTSRAYSGLPNRTSIQPLAGVGSHHSDQVLGGRTAEIQPDHLRADEEATQTKDRQYNAHPNQDENNPGDNQHEANDSPGLFHEVRSRAGVTGRAQGNHEADKSIEEEADGPGDIGIGARTVAMPRQLQQTGTSRGSCIFIRTTGESLPIK